VNEGTPKRRGERRPVEGPDLSRRLALGLQEAADALGVSERFLRSVLPELPATRLGGRVLLPVDELRAWLSQRVRQERRGREKLADEIVRELSGG
jgi:excisionase family DNA binding protein